MLNSYARINHPHTKTWLVAKKGDFYEINYIATNYVHITSGEHYIRKAFDPNASGIASLKWDSAELLKIGVQDQMSYDDAFTIEKVVIRTFYFETVYLFVYYVRRLMKS